MVGKPELVAAYSQSVRNNIPAFVSPLCGFSLSLFCNYIPAHVPNNVNMKNTVRTESLHNHGCM